MSISPISDAQIHALAQGVTRPCEFDRWSYPDACYLADFWDGLHFLLTGRPDAQTLPCAALKVGDISYRASPEAAHAIFGSTAQAFAGELQNLSEATLRQRYDPQAMLKAGVYPVRIWAFPEHAESTFRELMFYFERLRGVTLRATAQGDGLLFFRYEDW